MITFRKAGPEDLEEIGTLISEAIESMEKNGIHQWDSIYPTKADFREDIEKGDLEVGIADNKIAVVYAVNTNFEEEYNNGHWKLPDSTFRVIHRLCVHPSFQNRGIARKALEHIEGAQRELGVESIRLDAFTENPYALRLYEHYGYEIVGYADWRKGRFYLMEKQLL